MKGAWLACGPGTVKHFSAATYFLAPLTAPSSAFNIPSTPAASGR